MLLLATLLIGAAPTGKEAAHERTLASLDALADELDGLLQSAERFECGDWDNCKDCAGSTTKIHFTRDVNGKTYKRDSVHQCYWWWRKDGGGGPGRNGKCSMWDEDESKYTKLEATDRSGCTINSGTVM